MDPFYVVTTRFNNETHETNYAYRKIKGFVSSEIEEVYNYWNS